MRNPGKTKNEEARLAALNELAIIDTPNERQYDNITGMAAYICDTPIALINIVGAEKQWTKSQIGMGKCETARETSFCAHAILNEHEFMEVEDARLDERFKDNPNTTRAKKPVIYYAGYPLKDAQGYALGTLCLIDHKPRKLNKRQKQAMITLGKQVEMLFDLRLKNNELEKSKADLKHHNDLLKEFAGAVSHDLKMPLSSVILTIDLLKSKYGENLDQQALQYLKRLKQSAFGMSDYITNILEYYETEEISSKDVEEKPFGLKSFLEGILDMLNTESDCEINLPENNFNLICNHSGLEQIFLNLLGNSLKYNDKDKAVITIGAKEKNGFYEFEITDNGMGIPEEKRDKIFDLFSTAIPQDRQGKKGNGIGLSTVQKLVHKLGGEIGVNSVLGKSTTFSFSVKKQKPKK